jgi:hypothetical protein
MADPVVIDDDAGQEPRPYLQVQDTKLTDANRLSGLAGPGGKAAINAKVKTLSVTNKSTGGVMHLVSGEELDSFCVEAGVETIQGHYRPDVPLPILTLKASGAAQQVLKPAFAVWHLPDKAFIKRVTVWKQGGGPARVIDGRAKVTIEFE